MRKAGWDKTGCHWPPGRLSYLVKKIHYESIMRRLDFQTRPFINQ
jgi:hypothetical protein